MPVGAFTLYNSAKKHIIDGSVDLDNDTIKAILVTNSHVPSLAHSTYADITAECADADYLQQMLSGTGFSEAAGVVTFDCADIVFGTSVTLSGRYLVLVHQEGVSLAATDRLIGYMDLDDTGGNISSTGSNFIVRWNENGVFQLS